MAAAKSGPLLRLPFGLVFSYCNWPDLVATSARAVHAFSIAYQIADDLADIEADSRSVLGAAANIIGVLEAAGRTDRALVQGRAVLMARRWPISRPAITETASSAQILRSSPSIYPNEPSLTPRAARSACRRSMGCDM